MSLIPKDYTQKEKFTFKVKKKLKKKKSFLNRIILKLSLHLNTRVTTDQTFKTKDDKNDFVLFEAKEKEKRKKFKKLF